MRRYTVLMYKDGKGLLDQKGTGIDTTRKGGKKREKETDPSRPGETNIRDILNKLGKE